MGVYKPSHHPGLDVPGRCSRGPRAHIVALQQGNGDTFQGETVGEEAADDSATDDGDSLHLWHCLSSSPIQAHCHRGLGTLYAATGQREQARTELSTAVAMHRAMDMTFWLPQAKAALAQVDAR
jgi:hypothetical protein